MSIVKKLQEPKIWLTLAGLFLVLFVLTFFYSIAIKPLIDLVFATDNQIVPNTNTRANVNTQPTKEPGISYQVTVSADKSWQKQSFSFRKGDRVVINASGCVVWDPTLPCAKPRGAMDKGRYYSAYEIDKTRGFLLNVAPPGALLMRIGPDKYEIGKKPTIIINRSGTVHVGVNDHKRYLSDNTGSFKVQFRVTNRSKPNPDFDAKKPASGKRPASKKVKVCGYSISIEIKNKLGQMGGVGGILGCPEQNQLTAKSPRGTRGIYVNFKGNRTEPGALYLHTSGKYKGRVFVVRGCNYKLYKDLNRSSGYLGFPTSDEYDSQIGRRNDFEGGYIDWNSKTYQCRVYRK